MGKQETSCLVEHEDGERIGNMSLAIVAIKSVPDLMEDIIDELDVETEREVIQRYICKVPEYDAEPNNIYYISKVMHISRFHVNKIIQKFKQLIWSHLNG